MLKQSAYLNSATEAYHALVKSDLVFAENSSVPRPDLRMKMEEMLLDFSQGANKSSKVSPENRKIEALFLGPRAENSDTLKSMLLKGLEAHENSRLEYQLNDPTHITPDMKKSKSYLDSQDEMQSRLENLLMLLKKYTIPFYSPRYAGHMIWDVTLPGIAGYFAAMLYDPNNVAFEASPVTTILELLCAQDLCRLFDFPEFEPYLPGSPPEAGVVLSWGHLTCDGTMGNIEALWSSRNAKYYPLAIKRAISQEEDLRMISHKIKVKTAQMVPPVIVTSKEKEKPGEFRNKEKSFVDCSLWELMNIPLDQILDLTRQIHDLLQKAFSQKYKHVSDVYTMILQYSIQKKGLLDTYAEMRKIFPSEMPSSCSLARSLVSGSKHYSLPKAASLIGLGEEDLINVALTEDARLDVKDLKRKLKECFKHQIPVMTVILVMGSTEESSVDPLYDVLCLRDKYRQKHGLDFNIHADCAYGGYFKSLTKVSVPEVPDWHSFLSTTGPSTEKENEKEPPMLSGWRTGLNKHTQKQFNEALKHVDTLTVDPHKTGYIPYACGAFLYRNGLMKNMLLFTGPYLGSRGPNIGTFGVEGSKTGAQAAAVYLNHQCLPLDINGYGSLLGRTLFNTKLYYIKLLSFESRKQKKNWKFRVTPLPRLPSERHMEDLESDYDTIDRLSKMPNAEIAEQISENAKLREFFYEIGPDLNILAYNFNFYDPTSKKWNSSLNQMNKFTHAMYKKMSPNIVKPNRHTPQIPVGRVRDIDIFVSETEISPLNYGEKLFSSYIARTMCSRGSQQASTETEEIVRDADHVVLLRSVLMNPWTSETQSGDFFEIILEELDRICCEVMEEVETGHGHLGWDDFYRFDNSSL